ncbi:MAG: hypothetical protein IKM28_08765 [Lachnospiraceae bacterium]|nr:hypothetical protein [Lachnospiraceae bacterium]
MLHTGSVSKMLEVIKMIHQAGYTAVSSYCSGETEDTAMADVAAALNTSKKISERNQTIIQHRLWHCKNSCCSLCCLIAR